MISRLIHLSKTAIVVCGLGLSLTFAQTPTSKVGGSQNSRNLIELIYTSSVRSDGAAEIALSMAGQNGIEIHQERSESDHTIISRTILPPTSSFSSIHLNQLRLVLEKDKDANCVVLVLRTNAIPTQSIRLILPSEGIPRTGSFSIIDYPLPPEPGDGGCYPVRYTSDRCGTITKCCPNPFNVSIDGIRCTITCN